MAFKYMAFQMYSVFLFLRRMLMLKSIDHEVKADAPQQTQQITPNPNADKKEPEKWLNSTNKAGEITPNGLTYFKRNFRWKN
jgi:hypothetical protein